VFNTNQRLVGVHSVDLAFGGYASRPNSSDQGRLSAVPFDPDLRRRFEPFAQYDQRALLSDADLAAQWEEAFCNRVGYSPPAAHIVEHQVEGPIGPFRVRVYMPDDGDRSGQPVFVWAHGGGFMAGSIDMVEGDVLSRELATRANVTVVSVDYHLADGSVGYPTLHREVIAAYEWARAHYGGSGSAIVLGGGSAGGNLALAAALELRSTRRPLPERLVLVYPALHREHLFDPDLETEVSTLAMLRLDQRSLDFMFRRYAGAASETALLAPGEADPSGLPRCLVIVDEYDALRSSGERFVAAARAAGVDVDLYLAKGMPHGHLNMTPNVPEVDVSIDLLAKFIRAD
jgi:acetyl esterase/lipase